jgi:hypothetical protein
MEDDMRTHLMTLLLGSSLVALPLSAIASERKLTKADLETAHSQFKLPSLPEAMSIDWLNSRYDFAKQPNILGYHVDKVAPLIIDPSTARALLSVGGDGQGKLLVANDREKDLNTGVKTKGAN